MGNEQEIAEEDAPELEETSPASAGDRLREAREEKRLELSHIAGETRIPIRHLESIETSAFEALPSRTYAIGFAKTYARSVGLDPDEIAQAVREELADGHARASAISGGMEPGDPAKLPSAGLAWFGGFAALILALGVIFFYNTHFGAGTGPASLIAESDAADDAAETAQNGDAAQLASTGDAGTASGAAQPAPSASGQVVFTATGEGAWVRFYEDGGERLFEGVMQDGDTYEIPADAEDPRINTGRPNLFTITIGGQRVPPIAEEMIPVGNAPVSAEALLARADAPAGETANN
ncbi:helix-turn-helix domain-containing protein [uncultured Erythrobacter sp.]|uniref:helix-turn-helix domain-containing protein n=1 Tax=uncultured Erythrobacter sp. TaxID=263913 RepID=UPI002632B295|nr:helix-turn-helix domain-containing protein [uncultured Erythrobacter sp.]